MPAVVRQRFFDRSLRATQLEFATPWDVVPAWRLANASSQHIVVSDQNLPSVRVMPNLEPIERNLTKVISGRPSSIHL